MKQFVMQICALSVFCGLALSLIPEGSVKRMSGLCCMLLLTITALTAARSFDYSAYSLELSRYREMGRSLAVEAEERRSRLERLVIEQECADYIQQQAELLGIKKLRAEVGARWDTAGVWVPEFVRLNGEFSTEQSVKLQALITAELGIDELHQEWTLDEN